MRVALVFVAALTLALSGCGGGRTSTTAPRGGGGSIEGFGAEARGAERAALLDVFHGYLEAVAARDYRTACAHLTVTVRVSLARLSRSKRSNCVATLPVLLSPAAAAIDRGQAQGRVVRVRVGGPRGFVVFHAPGAELYQQTMAREGGEWKAATVATSVLVPSAASPRG